MRKLIFIFVINILIFLFVAIGCNCWLKQDENKYKSLNEHIENAFGNCVAYRKLKNATENFKNYFYCEFLKYDISFFPDSDDVEPESVKKVPATDELFVEFCGEDRFKINPQFKKNPIVTLGCSYTYGHGLKKQETFPFLLSSLSLRPVYNFAVCGGNALNSFDRTLEDKNFNPTEIQNADYYVYIYMYNHFGRYVSNYVLMNYYTELFKTSKIEHDLAQITLFRYIFCDFRRAQILRGYPNNKYQKEYLKNVMRLVKRKMEDFSPNAKLIVIIYDEKIPEKMINPDVIFLHDDELWNEISKETGCKVVHSKDLVGFKFDKNYKLPVDFAPCHPNAKVWKILTPKFKEKFIK